MPHLKKWGIENKALGVFGILLIVVLFDIEDQRKS